MPTMRGLALPDSVGAGSGGSRLAAAALERRVPSAAVGLVWALIAAWVATSAPATVAGRAGAAPASALMLVGAASCTAICTAICKGRGDGRQRRLGCGL